MKHHALLAIAAILLFFACDKDDPNDIPKRKSIILTRAEAEIIDAGQDFSFNLFREIAKDKGYRSIIMSPFSALIANCMLANGAEGETYEQIIKTIGYDGYSLDDINNTYKTVVIGLASVDRSTKLNIANSLWISKVLPVNDQFKNSIAENYDGYIGMVDFSKENTLKEMNGWVSKKTEGHISGILDFLSPDTDVILANALYFKGKWKEKFKAQNTMQDNFYKLDGEIADKWFMRTSQDLIYAESEDGKIRMCEIPYGNGAFVLDIVLPDKDMDFKSFIDEFSGETWETVFTYKNTHKVNLFLPKFKIESGLNLKKALVEMGMDLPYNEKYSNFSRISELLPFEVKETRQIAIIEVDENGTTAVASSHHKGGFYTSDGPKPEDVIVFKADHPFMFLIRENTSNTFLFMGTLTE